MKEAAMDKPRNRQKRQGETGTRAQRLRSGATRVHGGEMAGTRFVAGLTFHNRSINEGVTHEHLCRHVSQPVPSHGARRKRAGSTTSRSGGVWKIRTSRTRTTDACSLPARWRGIRCEGSSGRAHHSGASGAGYGSLKIKRSAISRLLRLQGVIAPAGERPNVLIGEVQSGQDKRPRRVAGVVDIGGVCAEQAGGVLGFGGVAHSRLRFRGAALVLRGRAAGHQCIPRNNATCEALNLAAVVRLPRPLCAREMPSGLPFADRLAADLKPCGQGAKADRVDCLGDGVRVHAQSLTDC